MIAWNIQCSTILNNVCLPSRSFSVCQPPLQALCRVWIILMEGCAEPNPWSSCWESAKVSTLCLRKAGWEDERATKWLMMQEQWQRLFPRGCCMRPAMISLLFGISKWSDNLNHLFILLKRDCRYELSQIPNSNRWQLKTVSIILLAIIRAVNRISPLDKHQNRQ